MSDQDQIKLAEAMGWTKVDLAGIGPCWQSPTNEVSYPPDPFTDAGCGFTQSVIMHEQP